MSLRARFLFLISLLVFSGSADRLHGQEASQPYFLKHFHNENGLPQNSVKAIVRGEYGFIWLATEVGLVRFDGRRFRLFNKKNTGIWTSRMLGIVRNKKDGAPYAISVDRQMLRVRKGMAYRTSKSVDEVLSLVVPRPGHQSVLVKPSWMPYDWIENYQVDTMQVNIDSRRSALVLKSGDILLFKDKVFQSKLWHKDAANFSRLFTLSDRLFLAPLDRSPIMEITEKGLVPIRIKGGPTDGADKRHWMVCANEAEGQVFFYNDQKLYFVTPDGDGLAAKLLLSDIDVDRDQFGAGYYDEEKDVIYLGSRSNGLYMYMPQYFKTATFGNPGGNLNVFYEQVPFDDSSVLTGKGIVLSAGSKGSRMLDSSLGRGHGYGDVLLKDRRGDVWMVGSDSLYKYAPGLDALLGRWVIPNPVSLFQGSGNSIWIGTGHDGIYRMDLDRSGARPQRFISGKDKIMALLQESDTLAWVATEGHLFRVNLENKAVDTLQPLTGKMVRGLFSFRPREVWIATYEDGLYLYRDKKLTHFPLDKMGYMNIVHGLLEDNKGFLWISTNNGLFQVPRAEMLQYAQGERKAEEMFYYYYNSSDGFLTNEFNGGSISVASRLGSGLFAFSSMNGIVFFNPETVKPIMPERPFIVDRVEVNGKDHVFSDTLFVQGKLERVNIWVSTFYEGAAENLQFGYRMILADGSQSDWQPIAGDMITYTALPKGFNQVVLRKRRGTGSNEYDYRTLVLHRSPVWWETTWVKAFVALLFIVLVWMLIALRLRFLRHKSTTLERIIDYRTMELQRIIGKLGDSEQVLEQELHFQKRLNENLAHDINTPLRYLALTARYLIEKLENGEQVTQQEMAQVHEGAERIFKYTEKLVGYMKLHMNAARLVPQSILLKEMVDELLIIFRTAAKERKNTFHNQVTADLSIMATRQMLEVVLHNLIDNAVKNTYDGTIRISAGKEQGRSWIRVEDTGRGIDKERTEALNAYFQTPGQVNEFYTGLGFRTIKDTLQVMRAKLTVKSELGKGTVFQIDV